MTQKNYENVKKVVDVIVGIWSVKYLYEIVFIGLPDSILSLILLGGAYLLIDKILQKFIKDDISEDTKNKEVEYEAKKLDMDNGLETTTEEKNI